MKKILFSAFAVLTLSLVCSNICFANYEMKTTPSIVKAAESTPVDVYKIKGNIYYPKAIRGYYDSDTGKITIEGNSYYVVQNTNKSGKRANFAFCANSIYFFNL